jgi:hypothetical protein
MRTAILWAGLAGLLATGCRVAPPRSAARQQAVRANTISNKRILTEQPTLERAAPRVVPGP